MTVVHVQRRLAVPLLPPQQQHPQPLRRPVRLFFLVVVVLRSAYHEAGGFSCTRTIFFRTEKCPATTKTTTAAGGGGVLLGAARGVGGETPTTTAAAAAAEATAGRTSSEGGGGGVGSGPATCRASTTTTGAISSDDEVYDVLAVELRRRPPAWWPQRHRNPTARGEDSGSADDEPTTRRRAFYYVFKRLAESSGRTAADAGQRAEAVLRYMLDRSSRCRDLVPDTVALNIVLDAYAKGVQKTGRLAANQRSADDAYRLFTYWRELHRRNGQGADDAGGVDRVSYNSLISCYGRARMPDRAEAVFAALHSRYEKTGDERDRPDAVSYGSLLHAYAVAGQSNRVGSLFQEMQQGRGPDPTLHSYNEVLLAYGKSDHPSAAEEFLQWWTEEDRGPVRPDTRSYNIVLHSLVNYNKGRNSNQNNGNSKERSNKTAADRAKRLFSAIPRPDKVSFTTFVQVLAARLQGKTAIDAVERVIERAWRDKRIRVGAGFLSNVLYSVALIEDRNMPVLAEKIVCDAVERGVRTNLSVYNALIYCWSCSKTGDRDGPRRAVELLSELETRRGLRPDVKTYANVLAALSKSINPKDLEVAESLVKRMEDESSLCSPRRLPPPNSHVYTTLIQNYARSRLPNKATKAYGVLRRMKENNIARPNIVSYNSVLNACEHTNPSDQVTKEEALKVACIVFDEIRGDPNVAATHVTYGTFLGVLANLMPSQSRRQIVELVFRRCCAEGQVSKLVLRKLRDAVPPAEQEDEDRYFELIKGYSESRLPYAWTSNVREVRARNHERRSS